MAGVLFALGVRSLVHWLSVRFEARSLGEHVLFALHATCRVGTWMALAAAFLGYALIVEPQRYRWFLVIVFVMAGVQLLTAGALGLRARGSAADASRRDSDGPRG
jgi:hypothetical protein